MGLRSGVLDMCGGAVNRTTSISVVTLSDIKSNGGSEGEPFML